MNKWEVELLVSSKCKIDRRMSFLAEKGDYDPFFSKVEIDNYYNSLSINIQANADSEEDAIEAGFYFIGQALNYMSWKTKSPFELYVQLEQAQLRKRISAKQVLDKEAWEKGFLYGRKIHIDNSKLAMSLGWYRKSLNNEDPIDSFLSRWLVIETLCNDIKLDPTLLKNKEDDKKNGGSKGEIFYQIKQQITSLGIPLDYDMLYSIKRRRNDIAHGSFVINDIDAIKEIIQMNNAITDVAYDLLTHEITKHDYC